MIGRISGAAVNQTRWITLREALEHIRSSKNCDAVAAQVHLKQAIGDGLISVKWADLNGPNDQPDKSELQRSQLVLWTDGLAPCRSYRLPRPLLLLRAAVGAVWPSTTVSAASPPEVNSNAEVSLAQPKLGEKYEQWMSLVEAIEHIRMSQDCNQVEALSQLKLEINDGTVRITWDNSTEPDDCPDLRHVGASQLLLVGTGVAPDNDEDEYRPLLVERSSVRKLWPLQTQQSKDLAPTEQSANPQCRPAQRASEAEVRRSLRKIYDDPSNDRPNVNEAWKLLKVAMPNARRSQVMEILQDEEFAVKRRPPGNQSKG